MSYYPNKPVREWRVEDRPREKISRKGTEACTDAELLALLLGSGFGNTSVVELSRHILEHFGNLTEASSASLDSFLSIRGIGPAKATSIMAAFELGRRVQFNTLQNKPMKGSRAAANFLRNRIGHKSQETFCAIFLNNKTEMISDEVMFVGGITSTVVDQRSLFRRALERNATKLIIGHNHPSGNLRPSRGDEMVTKRCFQAGEILNVQLVDHIIVGPGRDYYSFADEGLMPTWTLQS